MEDMKEKLYVLLKEKYKGEEEISFDEDMDLMEDLKMDSVAVMELLAEVEEAFGIQFSNVELLSENFSRLGNFCSLVERMAGQRE